MNWDWLDERPIVVVIAGPNGAGKTTFFHAHLAPTGLRFVNADVLADQIQVDAYTAAKVADHLRRELVRQRESFVFETVFSDPVGDKVAFLKEACSVGYQVTLFFLGLAHVGLSDERIAMRVAQGGHNVPHEKVVARFPRTLVNLRRAIAELPHVVVYDNSDLAKPYRQLAVFEQGKVVERVRRLPAWLKRAME